MVGLVWLLNGMAPAAEQAIPLATITSPISDFDEHTTPRDQFEAASARSLLFFTHVGLEGEELWTSDGTADGTRKVADLAARNLRGIEGQIFFIAVSPDSALWRSDGSTGGTVRLADNAARAWVARDRLFFVRGGPDAGLWTSDGTSSGTLGLGHSFGISAVAATRDAYFLLSVTNNYFELFRTDATPSGTARVWGIGNNPDCPSKAVTMAATASSVFFVTFTHGPCEGDFLHGPPHPDTSNSWGSDGMDTVHLVGGAGLQQPLALDDVVYFQGPTGLWKTDGSTGGTVEVVPGASGALAVVRERVLYRTVSEEGETQYWATDGGAEQEVLLATTSMPSAPVAVRNFLFFTSDDGATLWRTDGTPDGTRTVDVSLDSARIDTLNDVHGALFFTTHSSDELPIERQLWVLADCEQAADCDDGDPCSVDACQDGVCSVLPLGGEKTTLCRLDQALGHSLCPGAVLPRRLTRLETRLRRLVGRVSRVRNAKRRRALHRADAVLATMAKRGAALAARGRIEGGCAAAIDERNTEARHLLSLVSG